jgi:hypothetical protein
METKDPIERPAAKASPLPPLLLGTRLKALWDWLPVNRHVLSVLLGGLVGSGAAVAVRPHHTFVGLPSNSLVRQSMLPVMIDGCQYWMLTMGEPTNANWTASLTHSGTCTNWMAHKSYMQ